MPDLTHSWLSVSNVWRSAFPDDDELIVRLDLMYDEACCADAYRCLALLVKHINAQAEETNVDVGNADADSDDVALANYGCIIKTLLGAPFVPKMRKDPVSWEVLSVFCVFDKKINVTDSVCECKRVMNDLAVHYNVPLRVH